MVFKKSGLGLEKVVLKNRWSCYITDPNPKHKKF